LRHLRHAKACRNNLKKNQEFTSPFALAERLVDRDEETDDLGDLGGVPTVLGGRVLALRLLGAIDYPSVATVNGGEH
jgi:hypothetical protein